MTSPSQEPEQNASERSEIKKILALSRALIMQRILMQIEVIAGNSIVCDWLILIETIIEAMV